MRLQQIQNSNKLNIILIHLCYFFKVIRIIKDQEHNDYDRYEYGTSSNIIFCILVIL
jgi:hypothetical protein